ncbi:uncharacterized protein PG986_010079 [Apiospora aurea]|uniref:Uncharacterized protein n=1 Tax=Apiospora aurea TaxID=335848 RepID=A0ABR1Q9L5_9PEZI
MATRCVLLRAAAAGRQLSPTRPLAALSLATGAPSLASPLGRGGGGGRGGVGVGAPNFYSTDRSRIPPSTTRQSYCIPPNFLRRTGQGNIYLEMTVDQMAEDLAFATSTHAGPGGVFGPGRRQQFPEQAQGAASERCGHSPAPAAAVLKPVLPAPGRR